MCLKFKIQITSLGLRFLVMATTEYNQCKLCWIVISILMESNFEIACSSLSLCSHHGAVGNGKRDQISILFYTILLIVPRFKLFGNIKACFYLNYIQFLNKDVFFNFIFLNWLMRFSKQYLDTWQQIRFFERAIFPGLS